MIHACFFPCYVFCFFRVSDSPNRSVTVLRTQNMSGRSWSSIPSSAGSLPRWPARCGSCHSADSPKILNRRTRFFDSLDIWHVRLRALIIGWRTWPSSFASKKLGALRWPLCDYSRNVQRANKAEENVSCRRHLHRFFIFPWRSHFSWFWHLV